jgi:peroxiredoxin
MRGIVAAAAGLILLVGCSSAPLHDPPTAAVLDTPGQTYYAPSDRTPVPSLSGRTLTGSHLAFADLVDPGLLVLNVWASWCTECRAESRGLGALSAEFRTRGGVHFVGIDEQDVPSKARAFAAAEQVDYPQIVDADGRLLAKLTMLPSDGIPSTLIIDQQRRVAGRIIGSADQARLRALIERIAADH